MIALYVLLLSVPFFLLRPKDIFQPEFLVNVYYVVFIALGPLALLAVSPNMFTSGQYETVAELVILGYLCINIGFLVAEIRSKKTKSKWLKTAIVVAPRRFDYTLTVKMLVVFALAAIGFFYLRAGSIPILAENKEVARVDALSVGGNGYLLYIATLGMSAVLLSACKFYAENKKITLKKEFFLLMFALFIGAVLMGTGSRRYFFWSLIYLFIARNYFYKTVKVGYAVLLGVVAFIGVNVFEMFRNSASDTTTDMLTTSYYRLIVYFNNLEATFSAFQKIDFMWGSTFFMDIATIMPGKQIDYQSWVKEVTGLEFEGFGVPPTIVGDMYINFGVPGIIIGCILFGFAIKKFYNNRIRFKRSVFGIFTYALVLEISIRTLTSGFSAQTMGLLWITAVCFLVKYSNAFFSGSIKRSLRRLSTN